MNYRLSLCLVALTSFCHSCQKEPDWTEQSNEYLVYTQRDASFDANRYHNYFIADSILLIDDTAEPKYLKGQGSRKNNLQSGPKHGPFRISSGQR